MKATSIKAEVVPCSVLSMTFFDRLYNDHVIRESGAIQKCFDEPYFDMMVSDELRKVYTCIFIIHTGMCFFFVYVLQVIV